MNTVLVNTKSAWLSKTNWSAGIATALALVNQFSGVVPPKYQPYVTAASAVLGALAVFFHSTSTTITPAAAKKVS